MPTAIGENGYSFATFRIDPAKRILLENGEAVALNPKAFDLLLTLVERRGEIVSKDELLDTVWENQFVEQNNITVHISALRKIFGETRNEHRFIVTVPGKGYKFVADLNDDSTGEIIIENRSFSRIIIEEEPPPNRLQTTQVSAVPPSKTRYGSKKLFSALAAGVLVIGLAGYFFYQRFYVLQNFSAAWNDSALSVIEPRQLTASGKVEIAALSPDGNYFAFVISEADEQSLWFGQTTGNQKMQILPPEKIRYYSMTFAPGGSQIYFVASSEQIPQGVLFRIPTMGGAPQKVLEKIKSAITFSPDGRQIAFVRLDDERKHSMLVVADAESGANEREVVARAPESGFSLSGASWSPDGKLIAVGAKKGNPEFGDEVLLVSVGDGKIETFSSGIWNSVRRVAWLKDGSGLLVNVIEKDNWEDRDIWLIEYPTGQTRKITRDAYRYGAASLSVSEDNSKILGVREQSVSNIFVGVISDLKNSKPITANSMGKRDGTRGLAWTPDGRIVFSTFFDKFQTLWTMNADGANTRQLTPPGFVDRHLSVSKDGRFVFFDSLRDGVWNIWRISIDGGDLRQITNGGGVRPVITPDGKWVYYTGNFAGGYNSVWKVSAEGGESARVLEQTSDWTSISPDGTRFACIYRSEGEKPRLGVFPIEGGAPLSHFNFPAGTAFRNVRWMPNGESLVYNNAGSIVWQQAVSGGLPEKLVELPEKFIFSFEASHDGKQFAIAYGERSRDVVLVENNLK